MLQKSVQFFSLSIFFFTLSANAAEVVIQGLDHTCKITEEKRLFCKGSNHYGQLGIGNQEFQENYIEVELNGPVNQAALGDRHTTVITGDARRGFNVYSFGDNSQGQLGIQNSKLAFSTVPLISEIGSDTLDKSATAEFFIAADSFSTCIEATDEETFVSCWGAVQTDSNANLNYARGHEVLYSTGYGVGKMIEYTGMSVSAAGTGVRFSGRFVNGLGNGIRWIGSGVSSVGGSIHAFGRRFTNQAEELVRSNHPGERERANVLNIAGSVIRTTGATLDYTGNAVSGLGYCAQGLACGLDWTGRAANTLGNAAQESGRSGVETLQQPHVRLALSQVESWVVRGLKAAHRGMRRVGAWLYSFIPTGRTSI